MSFADCVRGGSGFGFQVWVDLKNVDDEVSRVGMSGRCDLADLHSA